MFLGRLRKVLLERRKKETKMALKLEDKDGCEEEE
jgi:hypothetical protein